MSEFAKEQPKKGDRVIACRHVPGLEPHYTGVHWWKVDPPNVATRPDGTRVAFGWILCCAPCFLECEGDPLKVLIESDGVWHSEAPVIGAKV